MTPKRNATPSPIPEKRPFWGQLEPGPYAVGYQTSFHCDYARSYDLFFPDRRPAIAPKQPRPLLVNVWYPAHRNTSAQPLRQGEYLEIFSQDPTLKSFSERLAAYHRGINDEGLMGKPRLELDATERTALDQFWQTPTAAIKNAFAEEGRFPLVLSHQGYDGNFIGNTVFFEFLASHGYIVVNSAFQSDDPAVLSIGHDINRSMKDMTYLLHHMQSRPQVDMARIGVMGESYGAQAVLAWAAEADPAVGAVVSLDTTLEYCRLDEEEVHLPGAIQVNVSLRDVRTRFDNAPRLSIPLLIFTQARLTPDFALYEKLPHAERYYAQVKFVSHLDFGSLVAVCRRLRPQPTQEPGVGNTQQIEEANEQICRLTLRFLDAYLKADELALAFLQNAGDAAADGDRVTRLVTWRYRKAAPLPLTETTEGSTSAPDHG